jgi:hypothetical protein
MKSRGSCSKRTSRSVRPPLSPRGSSHKQERHEKADAAKDSVRRTHDLIEAAFDKGEAQFFLGDELDKGFDPVDACLRRLDQLIVRGNSLNVNPDFDTQDWTNHT